MPNQYGGQPANISLAAGLPILLSGNSTPIAMGFSAPHGLNNGDEVQVVGHATNYTANGRWPVNVLNSMTIELVGSAGVAVGGNTGTCYPLTFGATYAQPSDGDALDAASVNVAFETLGDRTAQLAANMARYKLVANVAHPQVDDDVTEGSLWSTITFGSTDTWEQIATPAGLFGDLVANDILQIEASGSVSWNNSVWTFITLLGLFVSFNKSGVAPSSFPTGWTKVSGSGVRLNTSQGSSNGWDGWSLRGSIVVPANVQDVTVALCGWCGTSSSSPTLNFLGDYQFITKLWRPTDFVNRLA